MNRCISRHCSATAGERQTEPINRFPQQSTRLLMSQLPSGAVCKTHTRPSGRSRLLCQNYTQTYRRRAQPQPEGTITQTRHSTALHHCKHASNTRSHDSLQRMGGRGGGGCYSRLRLCVTNVMNGQKWTEDVKLDIYTVKDYSKAAQAIGSSAW